MLLVLLFVVFAEDKLCRTGSLDVVYKSFVVCVTRLFYMRVS